MEENNVSPASPKSSSRFKLISTSLLFFAFGLVAIGSYYTGRLRQISPSASPTPPAEVLGTEESLSPPVSPTEIPSLADEITPSPSSSPTISPTPNPIITINPSLKLKLPDMKIMPSSTPTPTPFPTIKFEQFRPELQIQP